MSQGPSTWRWPASGDPVRILARPRSPSVGTSLRRSQPLRVLLQTVDELLHRICRAVDSLVRKLAQHVVPNRRVACEKRASLLETQGFPPAAMMQLS
jgi:hypothetical protein